MRAPLSVDLLNFGHFGVRPDQASISWFTLSRSTIRGVMPLTAAGIRMTDPAAFTDELAFDETQLEAIRDMLACNPQFAVHLGAIQTFKLVIDLNMVARELKRRFQSYGERTLTERLVSAGILELHFPKWGETELNERGALTRISRNMNVGEQDMREQWAAYRCCLIIDQTTNGIEPGYAGVDDDTDTPYAVTMDKVGAIGILSADKKAFGPSRCRRMTREHVEMANAYAAAMADLLGLRISGMLVGTAGLLGLVELTRQLGRLWKIAPQWAQVLVVVCAGTAIASPSLRRRMIEGARPIAALAADAVSAALAADADPSQRVKEALLHLTPPADMKE